jgi:hypothetical protein
VVLRRPRGRLLFRAWSGHNMLHGVAAGCRRPTRHLCRVEGLKRVANTPPLAWICCRGRLICLAAPCGYARALRSAWALAFGRALTQECCTLGGCVWGAQ